MCAGMLCDCMCVTLSLSLTLVDVGQAHTIYSFAHVMLYIPQQNFRKMACHVTPVPATGSEVAFREVSLETSTVHNAI